MNNLQKSLIALAVGSLMSVSAQAAIDYTDGEAYFGVKAGQFDLDVTEADDPTAYGVYLGYNFDNNFGAELDYVGSDDADFRSGNIDAKAYGAYATYRYMFEDTGLYAKGKLGVARTEIEGGYTETALVTPPTTPPSQVVTTRTVDKSNTSLAGGLGLGYNVNSQFGVEAEYDIVDGDANLWTIGAHFLF